MLRQWLGLEEESTMLIKIVKQDTDHDLVTRLGAMRKDHLCSVVTHIAKGGDTVLHLAAVRGRIDSVRAMLVNKADVKVLDGHERSPLHACLRHNSVSSARLLVNFGADVNETVCRRTGESLLHVMVKGNKILAGEFLLGAGAALETTTKDEDTPLHFAARYNRPKMARFLTVMGADMNAKNSKQETPLHVAINNRSVDVAKYMLKNKVTVTAKDSQGMTALHLAVATGDLELVQLILTINSTQINSKESVLGRTPLFLACTISSPKMAALLLKYGADVNLTNNYRKSVLHVVASSGKINLLSSVMKHARNLNGFTTHNNTPLHCAVTASHTDVVKMLLSAAVNVNVRDMDGNTALHVASQSGNNDIVDVLIQHGAYVNITNMLQQTSLHLASMAGHETTILMLLNAGCESEILDVQRATALDYFNEFLYQSKEKTDNVDAINNGISKVRLWDSIVQEDEAEEDGGPGGCSNGEYQFNDNLSTLCEIRDINAPEVVLLVPPISHTDLFKDVTSHHNEEEISTNNNGTVNKYNADNSSVTAQEDGSDTSTESGVRYSKEEKGGNQKRFVHRSRRGRRKSRKSQSASSKNTQTGPTEVKSEDKRRKARQTECDQTSKGSYQRHRRKGVAILNSSLFLLF